MDNLTIYRVELTQGRCVMSRIDTVNLMMEYIRISDVDRRTDVCEWCKEEVDTSTSEIWSEAFPYGYLVRMCDSCSSARAGG